MGSDFKIEVIAKWSCLESNFKWEMDVGFMLLEWLDHSLVSPSEIRAQI